MLSKNEFFDKLSERLSDDYVYEIQGFGYCQDYNCGYGIIYFSKPETETNTSYKPHNFTNEEYVERVRKMYSHGN